jgi:hypothetical protein
MMPKGIEAYIKNARYTAMRQCDMPRFLCSKKSIVDLIV